MQHLINSETNTNKTPRCTYTDFYNKLLYYEYKFKLNKMKQIKVIQEKDKSDNDRIVIGGSFK
jgi:hypothetical protein